jgi:hypothetical protein
MTEEDKSILDKAKDLATDIKDKVVGLVSDNEDKIHGGIDKTGEFIDDKVTKGRFSEKIDKAQEATKGAVSKIAHSGDEDAGEKLADAADSAKDAAKETADAAKTAAEDVADEAAPDDTK